jgi:hypothetical protein
VVVSNVAEAPGWKKRRRKEFSFGMIEVAEFLEKEGLEEGTPLRRWDEAAQTYSPPLESTKLVGGGRYRAGPKPGVNCLGVVAYIP